MSANNPITQTQEWLEKAVIGLNLCPFAKAVHVKRQIRFVLSEARTTEELLSDLARELQYLEKIDASEVDTTLIIHPQVLNDFLEYNDFLDIADAALEALKLDGVIQIATFHPQYQFAGTEPDEITNFTNRSPFPMLHLLREQSVSKAVDAYPDTNKIPEINSKTLKKLGLAGWKKLGLS